MPERKFKFICSKSYAMSENIEFYVTLGSPIKDVCVKGEDSEIGQKWTILFSLNQNN